MVVASALKRGGVSNHAYGHLIEDIRSGPFSFIFYRLKSLMLGEKLVRQPMFWIDVLFLNF
jgi:hypothetical protein